MCTNDIIHCRLDIFASRITGPLWDLPVTGGFSITMDYRKTSNISRTLVGNKIVDNSDVVGALPVGAAPTTASFTT